VLRITAATPYDRLGRRVVEDTINPHHRSHIRAHHPSPKRLGFSGAPTRCCLLASMRMLNPSWRTTASATTAYNAQASLGLALLGLSPQLASNQGDVYQTARWVDVLRWAGNNKAHNAEKLGQREVNGKEAFQQKGPHVFDPDQMRTKPLEYRSSPNDTEWTNTEAMCEGGYASLNRAENSVNPHLIVLQNDSTLVELSQRRHNECARKLYIYHCLQRSNGQEI